jgi:hypothetical protein
MIYKYCSSLSVVLYFLLSHLAAQNPSNVISIDVSDTTGGAMTIPTMAKNY